MHASDADKILTGEMDIQIYVQVPLIHKSFRETVMLSKTKSDTAMCMSPEGPTTVERQPATMAKCHGLPGGVEVRGGSRRWTWTRSRSLRLTLSLFIQPAAKGPLPPQVRGGPPLTFSVRVVCCLFVVLFLGFCVCVLCTLCFSRFVQ
jgi:hypothetical protein